MEVVYTKGGALKLESPFYSFLFWILLCHTCLQPPRLDYPGIYALSTLALIFTSTLKT